MVGMISAVLFDFDALVRAPYRWPDGELFVPLDGRWIGLQPGTRRLLESFSQEKILLGLVSRWGWSKTVAVLEKLLLRRSFNAVVTRDCFRGELPSRRGYLIAAKRLRVPEHRCVLVCRNRASARVVKSTKMYCVGLSPWEGWMPRADMILSSFRGVSCRAFLNLLEEGLAVRARQADRWEL